MTLSPDERARERHSYRWVILGVALLTISTAYGVRNSFGVFLLPLQAEFGWTQSATVAAFSLHWLAFGLAAPFLGIAADRFSPRLTMPLGAVVLALALGLATQVRELWHFYLVYGIILGPAACALGAPPHAAIIARWFVDRRGAAYGVLTSAVGLSLLLAGPAQWLTSQYGWRAGLLGLGTMLVLVVAPVTLIFQRSLPPAVAARRADAGPAAGAAPATMRTGPLREQAPATMRQALRRRQFWLLAALYALYTAQLNVLVVYQLPYLVTRGYEPLVAASALSGTGVANALGMLSSGVPSDRFGREPVFAIGAALALVGVGALAAAAQGAGSLLPLYALAYGFGIGIVTPQMSASAADLFAGPRFGPIYGSFNTAAGLGGGLGPFLAGRIVETTGVYDLALAVVAVFVVAAAACLWLAAPRRWRLAGATPG